MPPRIALLEDDADTREMYRQLLEHAGFEVHGAALGAELLAHLQTSSPGPDAIVMDLGLPDAEGVALCRVIRTHDRFRRLPILAVTGWSTGPYVRGLNDAPFNEVFLKPVDTVMLLDALRRWIGAAAAARL